MSSNYLITSILEYAAAFADVEGDGQDWQIACRNLGNLLQSMGRFEEAINWNSLALEPQLNLAEVYSQLARICAQEKSLEIAIELFETALKYNPNAENIYANLAQIYGQLGNKESELDYWYKAISINPNLFDTQAYYKIAQAFKQQGKLEQAIDCFQKSEGLGKEVIAVSYELGEINLNRGDLASAKTCYQNILEKDPNQAQAHYKLGSIFLRQKQLKSAIEEFQHTIKLAPNFPWVYRDLIQIFVQREQWDEVIAVCNSITHLGEKFPWVYVQLGNALREKGRITNAALSFQKACVVRGWQECWDKDYFFEQDNFSYRIPLIEPHLQHLVNQESTNILEIGNYQGMSSCWLLDKILTAPDSKLTCLDREFDSKLQDNLLKAKAKHKVNLMAGDIHENLNSLSPNIFDLANLQDRRKQWEYVNQSTALVWRLMKVGGIIIFNDYGWHRNDMPELNPKKGIDNFLNSIPSQWEIIVESSGSLPFIVKKISE
ncbi:tetratricopeptide repeat protein [Xenococcus sp. PCC 7305]|uniref:tetratricopeptide repeat protein n=1 Tax=Xenococcus sp. PCC 7305 TaxID=102125 RepID=UPI0002ACD4BD|nr:tetratricopeptide repeat protein [Xenococcus sp. PCC 7305]ELS05061.1 tetratricopeptide repeat protein [Xenococcus sp. PCC 7305]